MYNVQLSARARAGQGQSGVCVSPKRISVLCKYICQYISKQSDEIAVRRYHALTTSEAKRVRR